MQILPQCIYQCISRRSHHTAYINPLSFLCRYKHISFLRQGTTLLMFMTQIYVSFDRLQYCTNYFGKMEIANRILFRLDQNYHFIILKEWFLIPLEPLSEIHVNKWQMIGTSLKIIVISCPLYIITSIHDLIKICDLQMKDKPGKKELLVLAYFPCNLLFDIL